MAKINVFCLHCGQQIPCEESCRGTQIRCRSCRQLFLVPQVKKTAVQPQRVAATMPTPPAPATATQPTPPPATTAVEASSAISPATEKIIRTKHTYLTEDKEWDGEDIPEGWRSASRGPTHPAAPVPIAAESAPPTVPSPTMKPAPVSVPVEVSFPRPAAQKKRIRVKPNYLAEANLKPAREAMKKVVAQRMKEFGQAGHAGDYKPIPLSQMAVEYKQLV